MDRAGDAEVEREEAIVLAKRVAASIKAALKARFGSDGLSGVRLHTSVCVEAEREVRDGIEIEFVLFVAVGIRVFTCEIKEVRVTEGERIALVGVVVQVFRVGIVGIEEEAVAHALAHADRKTAIERFCGAYCVRDSPQVREGNRA